MKKLLFALLFVFAICRISEAISCSFCSGSYVIGVDGKECVAVIKEKCSGMKSRTTGSWRRGIKVRDNCNNIPSGTAIATFFGVGATYNSGSYKHAAIFIGCEAGGIRVHDQWNGSGGCKSRLLRNGESSSNGADNFWTIV